jgi:hypothetical protein
MLGQRHRLSNVGVLNHDFDVWQSMWILHHIWYSARSQLSVTHESKSIMLKTIRRRRIDGDC